jgi:cell filamentation protein
MFDTFVSMKYDLNDSENEILPNILGLTSQSEIAIAEFEGFLKAEILLTENLSLKTKFDLKYILRIHKLSLEGLYTFAGKYRNVNMSKGGFPFAAAKFLPATMKAFEDEILIKLPNKYENESDLIRDVAVVHAELLVIHPFREGNGRTARILANLMVRKHGFEPLKFENVNEKMKDFYIAAVQQAATRKYDLMIHFIRSIFQD